MAVKHLKLKGKTLLVVVNKLSVQYEAGQKQNMVLSVFSEFAQKLTKMFSNFFEIPQPELHYLTTKALRPVLPNQVSVSPDLQQMTKVGCKH